nr:TonB-dependent receptor [Achromobacter sp. UBA2119]
MILIFHGAGILQPRDALCCLRHNRWGRGPAGRHRPQPNGGYILRPVPGSQPGQEINEMPIPSYTTYDAAVRYQLDKWQFALNVKNLANKTYVAACPYTCYYGDERNITLTARVNW